MADAPGMDMRICGEVDCVLRVRIGEESMRREIRTRRGELLGIYSHFDPGMIFRSGQMHHYTMWDPDTKKILEPREESRRTGYGLTFVAMGRARSFLVKENSITLDVTVEEWEKVWVPYFDLTTNYSMIHENLAENAIMRDVLRIGDGLRILKQDPYETIIEFILSQNANIPRIRRSLEAIARLYGSRLFTSEGVPGQYYSLPEAEILSGIAAEDLREKARVGYRDRYLTESARMLAESRINLQKCYIGELSEAKKELQRLPGVGPKVADCILLFGFGRKEAFPVDVWIRQVMQEVFLKRELPPARIERAGRALFGQYAGIAQQMLFFAAREGYSFPVDSIFR